MIVNPVNDSLYTKSGIGATHHKIDKKESRGKPVSYFINFTNFMDSDFPSPYLIPNTQYFLPYLLGFFVFSL